LGAFLCAASLGSVDAEYLDLADDEVLAIGTIEHIDAIKSISEVVSTPGLDVVFIRAGGSRDVDGSQGTA
jgi:4-hydroxy-2-oxoheptanedioate aldolase